MPRVGKKGWRKLPKSSLGMHFSTNDTTKEYPNMPDGAMVITNNEKYPISNVPEVKLTIRYNKYKVESI